MDWTNPTVYVIFGLAVLGGVFTAGKWIGGVNEFTKTVGKAIDEIQKDIKQIFLKLDGETSDGSPIRLTELGEKLAKEVNAEDLAKVVVCALADKIEGLNPYRIQQLCLEYVENDYDPSEDVVDIIERVAYDNGRETKGVRRVIAIIARDKLLKDSP